MKRSTIVLLIAIVLSNLLVAQEDNKKLFLSVGSGVAFPVHPKSFNNAYYAGLNFTGIIGISNQSSNMFGVGVDYSTISFKHDKKLQSADIKILIFHACTKYYLTEFKLRPYASGEIGLSITTLDKTITPVPQSIFPALPSSETATAFSFGLGFEYQQFFLETKYCYINNENFDALGTIPVRIGIKL